jgi:FtsH-binding integral membrane protein
MLRRSLQFERLDWVAIAVVGVCLAAVVAAAVEGRIGLAAYLGAMFAGVLALILARARRRAQGRGPSALTVTVFGVVMSVAALLLLTNTILRLVDDRIGVALSIANVVGSVIVLLFGGLSVLVGVSSLLVERRRQSST